MSRRRYTVEIWKKYNRLTIVEDMKVNSGKTLVRVVCDCWNIRLVNLDSLIYNNTKSCGCLSKEITSQKFYIHGACGTKLYRTWKGMKNRCNNKKSPFYQYYWWRWIIVCERWLESFGNFYEDMWEKPTPKHTIDRIDNNWNYCKENCRWSTRWEQIKNRRVTRLVQYNWEVKTISEVAEILGEKYMDAYNRLCRL